ncbi:tRNA lysidine(34) synthetase TilS [Thiocystis violascens]|uniref:tRNA(Ile)-lysidine synthase n=1 Tax=Thiocystis violascens (strain ATCC 17096 / DSM 198 / 6111) TaxID=765911 RepID=I3Y7A9_THIV6|nr:tRNA lysidine(34) synthetase TilS [Thiocystis violascens]AFL72877.1 tRNA(Ile)-lysidine synthetase [Thiocystis violascens DSM 198]
MTPFDPGNLAALLARFQNVSRCWIGFSGGLDSSVLLSAAASVRERLPGALQAVHLDHGLHPDSATWAAHCQSQCDALVIPLTIRCLHLQPHPGESIEAVAREARYRAFSSLLGPGDLLLAAHNRDDQAETLLLALLRGSGVQGLAAMPFEMPCGPGRLIRPLLDTTRETLTAYAQTQGLDWIDDPSNRVTSLDRNYLRHRVLPVLRERWPALATTLSRSASHCAEAAELTDRLAAQTLDGLGGAHPGTLDIPGLVRIDRVLQKSVLRLWLRRRGFVVPDTRHLRRILDEILTARADANPLVAWSGCEIRRYRRDLFALPPLPAPPSPASAINWSVGEEMTTLELPSGLGRLEWHPTAKGDRLSVIKGDETGQKTLKVRFGLTGLNCRRPADSHTRSLKKLYQTLGIPVWWRPYIPLVFDGDTLIAIADVCHCRERDAGVETMGELRWRGTFREKSASLDAVTLSGKMPDPGFLPA